MSSLRLEIALVSAARAKADQTSAGGKAKPLEAEQSSAVRRPMRRVLHPRLCSFAL